MSRADSTAAELREERSLERRNEFSMVRRFTVSLSSEVFWQLVGVPLMDRRSQEILDSEVFSGIGFYSRPPVGAEVDAAVVFAGGPENPMVVGLRDEATRRAVAGDISSDETVVYNSRAVLHAKANGTIELRSVGGTPEKVLKGETYSGDVNQLLSTFIKPAIALIANIPGLTAPQIAIVTAATTAIDAFVATAATRLSQVVKAE